MISKLYENIASGLKLVKACTVYQDDVPQNFDQPSFLITIYNNDSAAGINGKLHCNIGFDIMYFPQNEQSDGAKGECWEIAQKMHRLFTISDFKVKNRNTKIEDGVLHYMFDVDYRECETLTTATMQELIQNKAIKED